MPSKTSPPKPTPLALTRELLDVSVTERGQFKTCRRRWFLETIENLASKRPQMAFMFGTGWHAAMEAFYLAVGKAAKDPTAKAHKAFDTWYKEADAQLERDEQPMDVQDELFGMHKMGHVMIDNYVDFNTTAKINLGDVIAVEGLDAKTHKAMKPKNPPGYPKEATVVLHPSGRLMVPIVNPLTREPLTRKFNGQEVTAYLTARIDLLSQRKTPKKGLWVTDHKSASKPWDPKWIEFDDQATGYCYVAFRLLSKIPRGVVFNVAIKDQPKDPRVGKRGDLSYAKDQRTTPDMYREALREHGLLKRGKIISEPHAECMASLLAHGWDRFFFRYETTRNEHQLMSFEERLFFEYMDMEEALENHELLYPNPDTYKCRGCSVAPICLAMEDGSDYQDIIDNRFTLGEDRKA